MKIIFYLVLIFDIYTTKEISHELKYSIKFYESSMNAFRRIDKLQTISIVKSSRLISAIRFR